MPGAPVKISTTTTTTELVLKAPQLRSLVELLFRLRAHPDDKSAYIQHRLLAQRGLDRCPSCESELDLEGYRHTRTGFAERESLTCRGCRTIFILDERHRA